MCYNELYFQLLLLKLITAILEELFPNLNNTTAQEHLPTDCISFYIIPYLSSSLTTL